MANPNQIPYTNPWEDSRGQHTLQSPFQQRRLSEAVMSSANQYAGHSSQRVPRIGPVRANEFQIPSRSSVSSLSGAMGTASTSQRLSLSSEQSSDSSPSSEASNHSNQHRDLQMQWVEMGLQGSSSPASHSAHPQDLIAPGHPAGLLSFENLDVNPLHSPYTPPTSLSDLPGTQPPYIMTHAPYGQSNGRYGFSQRSSPTNGLAHSSLSNPLLPHSAPPVNSGNRASGFPSSVGMSMHNTHSPPAVFSTPTDETEKLKRFVHELQAHNQELVSRVDQLQGELAASRFAQASSMTSPTDSATGQNGFALPTIPNMAQHGHNQNAAQLDASWRRRTDARVRKFCAPNRAGNALCAWHDTRRERRAYPPRMAPEGTLNCGCTIAEALFEESLARHGVGSYLPGDSVRMDPALRNPLLRLLETRYGYRDGDFERNPLTNAWAEGEGPERWEAELQRHGGRCHR
ncbi:hypothetical protein M0805_002983 [Coniferiporia weirii]|nr:hypothetical protein M0805_002983 [Coniferiporia weirii]